jgi:ATP-binding cassette subfamily F protein uup
MPVKSLSGGERNRIILAKLFTRAANLLVLDEPTNDLDMETLEVLEARLTDYKGTLLVVSHDRQFLDNVVTSTVVFEEDAQVREYVGGYTDWLQQGHALAELENPDIAGKKSEPEPRSSRSGKPGKLNYRESRELEQLPGIIESLESDIERLQQQIAAPGFFASGQDTVQPILQELDNAQAQLEQLVDRWAELAE